MNRLETMVLSMAAAVIISAGAIINITMIKYGMNFVNRLAEVERQVEVLKNERPRY